VPVSSDELPEVLYVPHSEERTVVPGEIHSLFKQGIPQRSNGTPRDLTIDNRGTTVIAIDPWLLGGALTHDPNDPLTYRFAEKIPSVSPAAQLVLQWLLARSENQGLSMDGDHRHRRRRQRNLQALHAARKRRPGDVAGR